MDFKENSNQKKMEKVLGLLKAQGLDEKQIGKFIVNLNNFIAEQMQQRLIMAFSQEDLDEMDKLPDNQIEHEMVTRFEVRTGKKAQEVSDEILTTFLDAFIEEIESGENNGS